MAYCFNPACTWPHNVYGQVLCQACQFPLRLRDRYLALNLLAQGPWGRTLLAVDHWQPSRCVIQQFFPQPSGHRTVTSQWSRQTLHRLAHLTRHPQLPNLLEYVEAEGYRYLVYDWVEGQSLEDELSQTGPFSEANVRHLLENLLPLLQFLQGQQVIHRDIKPANIIRQRQNQRLYLVDLSAVKVGPAAALGLPGTVIGSAEYAAPEQTQGCATFASDLYSLGVTCIHLLTGVSPFELYHSYRSQWIWQDYTWQPISATLARILNRMIASAACHRYATAAEVLRELRPEWGSQFQLSQPMRQRPLKAPGNPSALQIDAWLEP